MKCRFGCVHTLTECCVAWGQGEIGGREIGNSVYWSHTEYERRECATKLENRLVATFETKVAAWWVRNRWLLSFLPSCPRRQFPRRQSGLFLLLTSGVRLFLHPLPITCAWPPRRARGNAWLKPHHLFFFLRYLVRWTQRSKQVCE